MARARNILRSWIKQRSAYYQLKFYSPKVIWRSPLRNIYHCCMVRTASTWLFDLFGDSRVYERTGLTTFSYQHYLPGKVDPRPSTYRPFDRPFPSRTIVKMFNDYLSFSETPKPGEYRAISVIRDPRDLLVSWYFAFRYSHAMKGQTPRLRAVLSTINEEEGLLFGIKHLDEVNVFSALRSWVENVDKDERVMLLRYEEMTGDDQPSVMGRIFRHCLISMNETELAELLDDHSFRKKTGGRGQGTEDEQAHYRKGISGDWPNHFTARVQDAFNEATGDLIEALGY